MKRAAWVLLFCLAACQRPVPRELAPRAGEFVVMSYNVFQYGLQDRDGDGQKNDPKPPDQQAAVLAVIAAVSPDVLALQEMGGSNVFQAFRTDLARAGLEYPHAELVQRGRAELNLALLSRFPITARAPHVDDEYSIGSASIPVSRGFLDVTLQVAPDYKLRLLVAHLKSKVFSVLGQTEMRRNEARLLNKHVRQAMKEDPEINLLVVGDLNDSYDSATLREACGKREVYLRDLRPRDDRGEVWTHFESGADDYERIDYLLANRNLWPEIARCGVIGNAATDRGSDHRPLVAVIRAHEAPAATNWMAAAAVQPPPLPEE